MTLICTVRMHFLTTVPAPRHHPWRVRANEGSILKLIVETENWYCFWMSQTFSIRFEFFSQFLQSWNSTNNSSLKKCFIFCCYFHWTSFNRNPTTVDVQKPDLCRFQTACNLNSYKKVSNRLLRNKHNSWPKLLF